MNKKEAMGRVAELKRIIQESADEMKKIADETGIEVEVQDPFFGRGGFYMNKDLSNAPDWMASSIGCSDYNYLSEEWVSSSEFC